jgi:hypothetical protein
MQWSLLDVSSRGFSKGLILVAGWALATVASVTPCNASVIQIMNLSDSLSTGGTYLTGTTKITGWTALANGTSVSSITDGLLTIGFSDTETKGQVGATFATWGSPPDTESSTPPILNTFANPNRTTRTLTFSSPLQVFGVEVEGGDFGPATFTMQFFQGAILLGTINRSVVGSGGARILAGDSTLAFDSVVITDTLLNGDNSFAMAQVRYVPAGVAAVPEPGTFALGLSGLAALMIARRRKRC